MLTAFHDNAGWQPYLDSIVVCVSGFGTNRSDHSGMRRVALELRSGHISARRQVVYYPWNASWKHIALQIHEDLKKTGEIVFVGHSYGCGHGLTLLAKHLLRCRRKIHTAFLVDPVVRFWTADVIFPFRALNLLSMTSWGRYRVPNNVERVFLWRQVNNTPMGREIIGDVIVKQARHYGSRQALHKHARHAHPSNVVLDTDKTHGNIDDDHTIHETIMEETLKIIT